MREIFVYLAGISEPGSLSENKQCFLDELVSLGLTRNITVNFLYAASEMPVNILNIFLADKVIVNLDSSEPFQVGYETSIAQEQNKLLGALTEHPNKTSKFLRALNLMDLNGVALAQLVQMTIEQPYQLDRSYTQMVCFEEMIVVLRENVDDHASILKSELLQQRYHALVNLTETFSLSLNVEVVSELSIQPVLPFAVEIHNLDCKNLTDTKVSHIKSLLSMHGLVIIRGQNLDQAEQIHFTEFFGKPDYAWDNRNRDEAHPTIQIISNQYAGGDYLYNRKKLSSVRFWHTDTSFLEDPTRITLLHVKAIPQEGGDTKFINTRLAYEALSSDMKLAIEGKTACHSFHYFFERLLNERGISREDEITDAHHPIVMETSSGKSLYISKLALSHVDGLEEIENEKLLTRLYEHCKKSDFRYRHKWQPGDILIWDNFVTMHKGTFTDPAYPRVLNRTTIRNSEFRI